MTGLAIKDKLKLKWLRGRVWDLESDGQLAVWVRILPVPICNLSSLGLVITCRQCCVLVIAGVIPNTALQYKMGPGRAEYDECDC